MINQWSTIAIVTLVLLPACTTTESAYRVEEQFLGSRIPKYEVKVNPIKTDVTGALSKTLVLESVATKQEVVEYCYEDALLKDKDLQGQGIWKLSTDKQGRITAFAYQDDVSTLKSPFLIECVSHHLIRTRFPASIKGDSQLKLHYIFSLLKT